MADEIIASKVDQGTGHVQLSEEEKNDVFGDEPGEGGEGTPAAPAAPINNETPEPTPQPTASQEVEPEKGNGQGEGNENPEKLFVGKFKTLEELEEGFVQLGGNPSRYAGKPALLEEAYEIREREFSRARQQAQELLRLENLPNTETPTPIRDGQHSVDPDALLAKVQWDKVTDAQSLGRELIGIMAGLIPTGQPQMSPEQLVQQITPIIQKRQQISDQLSELERDVPRLRYTEGQENPFRQAFANFITGQKANKSYVDPKTSFKQFLDFSVEVSKLQQTQKNENLDARRDAGAPQGTGDGLPAKAGDEADEIIGAFADRQKKLGITH